MIIPDMRADFAGSVLSFYVLMTRVVLFMRINTQIKGKNAYCFFGAIVIK